MPGMLPGDKKTKLGKIGLDDKQCADTYFNIMC